MKNFLLFKRKAGATDLTTGNPIKRILVFMIPMLIGNVFQQLYSMVDTIIVGQALGADALAGVSFTGAMSFLILGFVSGLTHGFSVVVSQRRGARDEEGMKRSFATGLVLTVAIVAVMTAIALSIAKPMLVAMKTNPAFLPYSLEYITIIFGGMLLAALYNLFASTLRAIGDSVVPLYFLILASFLNAGMDCLTVFVFDMGVGGAAAATVTANGISAVLTFIYIWIKYPVLRFKKRHFTPNIKRYIEHVRLGIPMALQMSIISIGMIFGQTALNTMDVVPQKAYAAATKVDGLANSMLSSVGAATATYVGQNYGAKRYDRIKHGVFRFALLTAGASVVLGALILALHRPLIMLFISAADRSEELFDCALKYLVFNGGFYILLSNIYIFRSGLQGMGRGTFALFSGATEVVMRVCAALIAINLHSFTFVCANNLMSWAGANLFLIPAFLTVLKKYIPLTQKGMSRMRLPNPSVPIYKREKY